SGSRSPHFRTFRRLITCYGKNGVLIFHEFSGLGRHPVAATFMRPLRLSRLTLPISAALLGVLLELCAAPVAGAGPCDSLPQLRPRAIELGVAGSTRSAGGATEADAALQAGLFFAAGRVLAEAR